MRNNFVYGLLSVVVGAISTLTGYGQLTSLTEGFDTVGSSGPPPTGIFASGWIVINNSSPLGNHTWNQGIPPPQLNTLGALMRKVALRILLSRRILMLVYPVPAR